MKFDGNPEDYVRPARAGEEELRSVAVQIKQRLFNDWDLDIAICGEEGTGKSTLSMVLGWYLSKDFNVERNTIANPNLKDITDKLLREVPNYEPVIIDEAIKVLYKLGWQAQAQVLLNTVFSVCRAQNKAIMLCMPAFMDFNSYQRKHRIKLWIEVIERGKAIAFVKDKNIFVEDGWHIKTNQKIIDKSLGQRRIIDLSHNDYVRAFKKCKNYAWEFTFKDMPAKVKKDYDKLKQDVADTFEVDDVKGVARLYREAAKQSVGILYKENGMTQPQISESLGLSIFVVNNFLRDLGMRKTDIKKSRSMPRRVDDVLSEVDTFNSNQNI